MLILETARYIVSFFDLFSLLCHVSLCVHERREMMSGRLNFVSLRADLNWVFSCGCEMILAWVRFAVSRKDKDCEGSEE